MTTETRYVTFQGIATNEENAVPQNKVTHLMGWSARESDGTGATAAFDIMDGATVAGGTTVVDVEFAANTSDTHWFGPQGVRVMNGLTIKVVNGTVDVTLYYRDDWEG